MWRCLIILESHQNFRYHLSISGSPSNHYFYLLRRAFTACARARSYPRDEFVIFLFLSVIVRRFKDIRVHRSYFTLNNTHVQGIVLRNAINLLLETFWSGTSRRQLETFYQIKCINQNVTYILFDGATGLLNLNNHLISGIVRMTRKFCLTLIEER